MRTERFNVSGDLTLNVRLPSGEIEVETAETSEAVVELIPADQRAEEQVEAAIVELRPSASGQQLLVDCETEKFGFGGPRFSITISGRKGDIRVRVRVPHGTSLEIATASADVNGQGRFGAAAIKSASGDVVLSELEGACAVKVASGDVNLAKVGGPLVVQSASGDLRIGEVEGRAELKSASGDVMVDDAASDLSIQTASGDQVVRAVREGSVLLKSISGDVLVGIREGSRLWVDAKTVTGDTRSELEISDAPVDEAGPMIELRATAMSGDIRVVRAAAMPFTG